MESLPEVTKQTPLAVSTANREGFDSPTSQEDLIIPRAKLFHGLPTEYEDYPDAKPGQILNNVTKEPLPVVFIPIIRAVEWIRFNPQDAKDPNFNPQVEPGAVIWRSSDPNDPRVVEEGKFGEDGTPPLATKFLSFLSFFPGVLMPVIVSFSKTSFKAGKQLNSLLTFATGPMWSQKFSLTSRLTKSGGYSYYVFVVNQAGKPTDEELAICSGVYSQFKHKKIEVEVPADKPAEDWK